MEPKYTFQLGLNMDTVQIGEQLLVVNSRAMIAEYVEPHDFFSVVLDNGDGIEIEFFGMVLSTPEKKTDDGVDSYWFTATRVNA